MSPVWIAVISALVGAAIAAAAARLLYVRQRAAAARLDQRWAEASGVAAQRDAVRQFFESGFSVATWVRDLPPPEADPARDAVLKEAVQRRDRCHDLCDHARRTVDSAELQKVLRQVDGDVTALLDRVLAGVPAPDLTALHTSLGDLRDAANRRLRIPLQARNPRAHRAYGTSPLPVLAADPRPREEAERAVLLAAYGEACAGWRLLTDVRFKLLALVPPLAALGLLAVVSPKGVLEGAAPWVRTFIALFGLAVTAGVFIYDMRNSELYDDLISRGRRAEAELGLDTGVFLGRPEPKRSWVRHGVATSLVFGAVLVAWAAAIVITATGALT